MITIFCDMDGVLCDFKSTYRKYFMDELGQAAVEGEFNRDIFDKFVQAGEFAKLPELPNTKNLLKFLQNMEYDNKNINIEILSSIGNYSNPIVVCEQKQTWLVNHGIRWKANFVRHKGLKKRFATPSSILIDDTHQNIYDFEEHFGIGVYYKDYKFESAMDKLTENLYRLNLYNKMRDYSFVT